MPNSYYGETLQSYGDQPDDSPLNKVKQQFWNVKQNIICKLGRREDEHLVASDNELDAKLQAYDSIKMTCENLLRCIERYQDYICDLSQEENALGRFLKTQGKADKTQAGKIMAAVGRAQSYTAQQRLALRLPLVRLYQELDVFTERAVADCQATVERVEDLRTQYRGSLLWMKNASQNLDPDAGRRRLDKFREVQLQVKRNKSRFDTLKLDCLQKIDLLAASRCNLFSQGLATYTTTLLAFWDRTVKAYDVITDSFKGHQYYEFKILKGLTDVSLKPEMEKVETKSESNDENKNAAENELIVFAQESGSIVRSESMENFFKDSPENEKVTDFANIKDELKDIFNASYNKSKPLPASGQSSNESGAPLRNNANILMDMFEENDLIDQQASMPATDILSFSSQWEQAFGSDKNTVLTSKIGDTASNVNPTKSLNSMLPSDLLDLKWPSNPALNLMNLFGKDATSNVKAMNNAKQTLADNKTDKNKKGWLDLFADVDPLQNPEAFGKALGSSGDGC